MGPFVGEPARDVTSVAGVAEVTTTLGVARPRPAQSSFRTTVVFRGTWVPGEGSLPATRSSPM